MAVDNQQILDPSTQGVGGLKGLEGVDRLKQKGIDIDTSILNLAKDYRGTASLIQDTAAPKLNIGTVGLNDSMYDEDITSATQLDDLANTRGELQPWYAQIGAGLAKGAVLAGTTFADGIVGSIVGIGNAARTGTFSGFWDNPFSNAMQLVNEWSELTLPNYYTKAEQEDPWYTNVFTSNFIGDKFIKNLGFAVGAAYSGKLGAGVTSRLLGLNKARQAFKGAVTASGEALNPQLAYKAYMQGDAFLDGVLLTEDLARSAKQLKFAEPTLKLTGAFSGALGEARIEAINNSKDWFNLHKQQLDDARASVEANEREALLRENPNLSTYTIGEDGNFEEVLTPEGQAILEGRVNDKFNYEDGLKKITEDRTKLGNIDFLLNVPLLTVSDAWLFGKFYAGGYNTAKKAGNITKTLAEDGSTVYEAIKPSKIRTAAKLASKAIAEGPYEEMGLSVAGLVAGIKYASELNDFYGAKIDPDAESETIDWMKATAKAIQLTYGTVEGWEEGFIGGLTGLVGIPGFRGVRNSEGRLQSPVFLQGGIKEDIQEINESNLRADEIVALLNARVQSPEFLNYYQSAIRHNKYQRDMDEAADNNDNFEFKNAEHNQLINDVIMYDKAGRIQDLYDIIDEAGTVKPEDVDQIRQLTTNQETGLSVYDNMTDEEVIALIQKQAEETKEQVDKYRKISSDLQVRMGDQFSEDGLEEMTYLMSNIDNLEDRFKSLVSDVQNTLRTNIAALETNNAVSEEEAENVRFLASSSPETLISILNSENNKEFIEGMNKTGELVSKLYPSLLVTPLSELLSDLTKIAEKRKNFIDTYAGYAKNPQALLDKIDNQTNTVLQDKLNEEAAKLKDSLVQANNLNEFRNALNNESDASKKAEMLKQLEDEGNQMAKEYREVETYNNDLLRAISNLDDTPMVKDDAITLLNEAYANAQNLQEIANPDYANSQGTLYDPNLSDDANLEKFLNAEYALQRARNIVNNDNKFKDRFSGEYKRPAEKGNPSPLAPAKESTGDSGTPTIPSVNPSAAPVDTYEPPVGNITSTMVNEENLKSNDRVETPLSLDSGLKGKRQYYRPSIPELHINATKEGDFRPFNVVAAEREKGVNFDDLYNYLRDNGAFNYVNEGNLKVGDELGFMIDNDFNDHTIFIVDTRNNQIVGSLDESSYSVDRYEGLQGLEDKIKAEYAKSNKSGRFIATPTTRVSLVMIGKIPFGKEENSLADIPNVTGEGVTPIFGIVKNGTLSTNDKVKDNLVIKPMDMSLKEGRMYLLIPNARGMYSPAAVRVKHFNKQEFNLDEATVNSTPMARNIKASIDALASVNNEDDLNNAVKYLGRDLYIGDLHIDYVRSESGNGIRFTKVQRDANGKELYTEVNGQRVRLEDSRVVFLTEKWDPNTLYEIGGDNSISTSPEVKDADSIMREITDILYGFNLPILVNLGMLNNTAYNNLLINSNVLTSNISDARVLSSWFTTDYFDIEGNLHLALNPALAKPEERRNIQTPVGGQEGVLKGTKITMGTNDYYVDLSTGNILNSNGQRLQPSDENSRLMFDLAYIQSNFGEALNGSLMIDGKAVLPDGRVLDRNKQTYLTGEQALNVKIQIAGRDKTKADSNKVISQIEENQKKVDKTKTDGQYYYILEDDGEFYPYDRVHTRLGSNWVQSEKLTKTLTDLRVRLSELADSTTKFNNYLTNLGQHYNIDLSDFAGKVDARNRDTIVNIVRDKMSGTNSQRALEAGTAVDSIIRNFFTSNDTPIRPSNMSDSAFIDLINSLTEIKSNIEARGERFLTNNVVLFQKYADGSRIAGEVDILSVDSNGNFRIYDVKTSRYSFHDFIDSRGNKVNYFVNKSNTLNMSTKDYYTQLLSAYRNLFESQYSTPVTTLAILPFVLDYSGDNISKVTKEKGILIDYNPNVNVPLSSQVKEVNPKDDNTDSSIPVFNSALETMEPVNNVLPEYGLEESKIGYYVSDGKIHKSYLSPIGVINNIEVYLTKVPSITKGFGDLAAHVAANSFLAVFPNGNSIELIKNAGLDMTEKQAKDLIKSKLEGNPLRVVDMSNVETLMYKPSQSGSLIITPPVTSADILSPKPPIQGAALALQELLSIITPNARRRKKSLRQVDYERPIWNLEKELAWLNRVLPLLSENELVHINKGLILVAEKGANAWGLFKDGIVTLSDIAAKGTTYHEAFHVVFTLMTDDSNRESLFREAREIYGDLSEYELEDQMAEGFRRFVMASNVESPSLLDRAYNAIEFGSDYLFGDEENAQRAWREYKEKASKDKSLINYIIDLFKSLMYKVRFWNYYSPSLTALYYDINNGRYKGVSIKVQPLNRQTNETSNQLWSDINEESKEYLEKKGWTEEQWNSISQQERELALDCVSL